MKIKLLEHFSFHSFLILIFSKDGQNDVIVVDDDVDNDHSINLECSSADNYGRISLCPYNIKLHELHWFPAGLQVKFQVLVIIFIVLHGIGSGYLTSFFQEYLPVSDTSTERACYRFILLNLVILGALEGVPFLWLPLFSGTNY